MPCPRRSVVGPGLEQCWPSLSKVRQEGRSWSRGNETWQARQGPEMPGNAATYGMLLTAKAMHSLGLFPLYHSQLVVLEHVMTLVQTTSMSISPGVPEGFTSELSVCYRRQLVGLLIEKLYSPPSHHHLWLPLLPPWIRLHSLPLSFKFHERPFHNSNLASSSFAITPCLTCNSAITLSL